MSKSLGYRIYLLSVVGATVLALVLRTLALFFDFDAIGYFSDNALSVLTVILQVLAVAGCIVYPFLIQKDTSKELALPALRIGRPAAVLVALFVAAMGVLLLLHATELGHPLFATLAAVFLLMGALYFVLRALGRGGSLSFLAFGVILGAIFLVMLTYFDLYTPMNAPRKTSLHLCLLAVALYMLYELRGAVSVPMPRASLAASTVCFFLTLSMSGSNLIYSLSRDPNSLYLLGDTLCLVIGLYAGCSTADTLLPARTASVPEEAGPIPEQEDDQ